MNGAVMAGGSEALIVDHKCTSLDQIPQSLIEKAKEKFKIAYGHTSHGSQLVSGMTVLADKDSLYAFNSTGAGGALELHDYAMPGDLGHNGDTRWADETRDYLNQAENKDINMIIWSWCGGVSDNTEEGIKIYLETMSALEKEFPDVTFVYMTGHLDGTGEEGNLHARNEQIRQYCRANGKVLFDFADIESYDPDNNYFLDKYADDGCFYDSDGDGRPDFANWADEWCNANPGQCSTVRCAHSRSLNCDQKGRAVWWMLANLAAKSNEDSGGGENGIRRGDVNGDGNLSIVDALLVARAAVGLGQGGVDNEMADVNCDQVVSIVDALLIARRCVGLETFGWCQD